MQRVRALIDADGPEIAPGCGTIFLSHGRPTDHVIVFLHGLTNCPAQFDSLGRLCFERGATVIIPRLPRHGMADRMTDELSRSDANELREITDRVIDAAQGRAGGSPSSGCRWGGRWPRGRGSTGPTSGMRS